MTTVSLKEHLEKLIREANQKEALTLLYNWAKKHDDYLNPQVILLTSRFSSLQNELNAGTLDQRDAKITLAQITAALSSLIENLPGNALIQVEENRHPQKDDPPKPASGPLKILMLTAKPSGTDPTINLDKEQARIAEKIQNKKNDFDLIVQRAVDKTEFRETTETLRPQILHFSGHGDVEEGGIFLLNDDKNDYEILSSDELDALFEYFAEEGLDFKAVVLNACYSDEQAQAIAKHVPYVVGTTIAIGDKLAIAFSVGFYFKLEKSGLNIEQAFKSGRVAAQMVGAKKPHFVLFKDGNKLDL